eukprot:1006699-Pyramimonas_sp.AAC.1
MPELACQTSCPALSMDASPHPPCFEGGRSTPTPFYLRPGKLTDPANCAGLVFALLSLLGGPRRQSWIRLKAP